MQTVDLIQYKYDEEVKAAKRIDLDFAALAGVDWHIEGRLLRLIRDNKYWKLLGFLSFPAYCRDRAPKIEKEEIQKRIKTSELRDFIEENSSFEPPHNRSLALKLLYGVKYPAEIPKLFKSDIRFKFRFLVEIWGFYIDFCQCDLDDGGEGKKNCKSFDLFCSKFFELFQDDEEDFEIQDEEDEEDEEISIDDIVNHIVDLQKMLSEFKKMNQNNAVQIKNALLPSLLILKMHLDNDKFENLQHIGRCHK